MTRCVAEHGARPAEYLERVGLLGRGNAARARRLAGRDRAGADRLAWRDRGHESGRQPEARRRAGVPVPGRASSRGPRRARDGRTGLQQLARPAPGPEDVRPPPKARGARSRRRVPPPRPGSSPPAAGAAPRGLRRLAVGEPADFLLLRAGAPELEIGDFAAGLVYAASGSVVDTTVVNGRVLMRGGRVEGERRGARPRARAGPPPGPRHLAARRRGAPTVAQWAGAGARCRCAPQGLGARGPRPNRAAPPLGEGLVEIVLEQREAFEPGHLRDRAVDLADLLAALRRRRRTGRSPARRPPPRS